MALYTEYKVFSGIIRYTIISIENSKQGKCHKNMFRTYHFEINPISLIRIIVVYSNVIKMLVIPKK